MYQYFAVIDRIVDGDTIDLLVDLGFEVLHRIRVRLEGVQAPEVRGPEREDGLAWTRLLGWLVEQHGTKVVIETKKVGSRDKYGRWVGQITWHPSGLSLNQEIVRLGTERVPERAS